MLPFVASQAIALSQVQHKASAPQEHVETAQPATNSGLLARVFDALVVSRMRRAEFEIEAYRRLREEVDAK